MRNARFWDYINGDHVKITLAPDCEHRHRRFAETEEGFCSEINVWEHSGDSVTRHCYTRSRDCDGLYEREYRDTCKLGELRARHIVDMPPMPQWTNEKESQRDHTAESMNY